MYEHGGVKYKKRDLLFRISTYESTPRVRPSPRRHSRPPKPKMFLLNPYDADLDISNKDDKKLFLETYKGIPEFEFGGEKNKIIEFLKLLKVGLDNCQLSETFSIATKWTASDRNPCTVADILKKISLKSELVKIHTDLV